MDSRTSVLVAMPLYNAEPYVAQAVESILSQTCGDFLLLVIDDGSTDGGPAIVHSFEDSRILVWHQENRGPAAAMNRAIGFAAEKHIPYIARTDADDLSLPRRLETQKRLLDADPSLDACSANCYYIDAVTSRVIGSSRVPHSPWLVRWEIQQGFRGLIQGAAMFRTEALVRVAGYREQFRNAEDTDLFLRLSEQSRLANCREFLYQIRLHDRSLSLQDAHQNRLYHLYALDCDARRRRHQAERTLAEFASANDLHSRWAMWREVTLLGLWRKAMREKSIGDVLVAALLDPRRVAARLARRIL